MEYQIIDGARFVSRQSCFRNAISACWSLGLKALKRRMTSRASLRLVFEVALSYAGQITSAGDDP